MNEVERNLKLSDSILRYLSVLVDEEIDPQVIRAEIAAQRQRSAEARAAAEAARAAADAARAVAAAERASQQQAEANARETGASESVSDGEPPTEAPSEHED